MDSHRTSTQPNQQQCLRRIHNLPRVPVSSQIRYRDLCPYHDQAKMSPKTQRLALVTEGGITKEQAQSEGQWFRSWPGYVPTPGENAKTTLTGRTSGHHYPPTQFPSPASPHKTEHLECYFLSSHSSPSFFM